jgi:hypothetical protein
MIELKRLELSETGHRNYQVTVDGIPVEKGYAFSLTLQGGIEQIFAQLVEEEDSKRLAAHRFSELPSKLYEVGLGLDFDWPEGVFEAQVRRDDDAASSFQIRFNFVFAFEDWKGSYSFAEYAHAVEEAVVELNTPGVQWIGHEEDLANGFRVVFAVESPDSRIIEEISRCSIVLKQLEETASGLLDSEVDEKSLVVSFDFPDEIRVPCEQYLLYFVQFLKDLGVDATSNLEHRSGRVLFSVTPSDERDALDKIRETLELYLHFPSSPFGNTDNESIAVQRLESNVLHLRSELKLAAAEVQAKNATIQAQQLTIEVQKGLLSSDIMLDAMKDVTPKPEDKESLLGGVVALGTFKEKGFEVNWGELLRKLKSRFAKK